MTDLPEGFGRITPYLLYRDTDAAVDFLTRAAGFTEKLRMRGEDGKTNHAELEIGGTIVMLGNPGGDYKNPNELGAARS